MNVRIDSRMPAHTILEPPKASSDVWLLIACFAGLYVTVGVLVNAYVLTPEVLDQAWMGAHAQVEEFAAQRETWRLYGYFLTPLFVMGRIGFTAAALSVGCALMYWDVRFSDLFRVSTYAETVWAVAAVVHLACVLYLVDIDSLLDFSTFFPLSALHFVDLGEEDVWAVYLLKSLNLFEVGYVAAVTTGLRNVIRCPLASVASLVAVSYGGGLLLLVSAVTFMMMALT